MSGIFFLRRMSDKSTDLFQIYINIYLMNLSEYLSMIRCIYNKGKTTDLTAFLHFQAIRVTKAE